ncbi:MAG: hypothetical protein ACI8XO_002086 [Verrucomicrobiales bacterium]|jgi:hypothetical protein
MKLGVLLVTCAALALAFTNVQAQDSPPEAVTLKKEIIPVAHLREEYRVLRYRLGSKRLRFTDAEHYHRERNHQGLANRFIEAASGAGKVVQESRIGGLLNHYRRAT